MNSTKSMALGSVRWGMIGCGDVTEVKSGPAFNKINHSLLVAVMRRDSQKAMDYAQRHGISTWYSDADELINNPRINSIYVATPPKFHELYATKAMLAGKNVYIEKPVTIDTAACIRLIEIAKQTNQKITVAHYRRALPMFEAIKELLNTNTIGKIKTVTIRFYQPHQSSVIATTENNWRLNAEIAGGGLFYDIAPHQIDMLLFLLGDAVKYNGISTNQANLYEVDDTVTGMIQFANNALFSGNWCFTMPANNQEDYCSIMGEEGAINFSFYSNQFSLQTSKGTKDFEFQQPKHIQQPMIAQVVDYFMDERQNPCSLEEAYQSLHIMETFTTKKAN